MDIDTPIDLAALNIEVENILDEKGTELPLIFCAIAQILSNAR